MDPKATLNQQYDEKVRPLIDLIDSLRSLGVEKDLALPAIAVIGDQSSGKSSVLEALSGVALPRGSGELSYFLLPRNFKAISLVEISSSETQTQSLIGIGMLVLKRGNTDTPV
uniref:Dynamin N-terminal domain-containing protein n=1 Tax=Pundamilia nyererei TaxID=303518 RepID=A0A3B4EZZ8_9CICH